MYYVYPSGLDMTMNIIYFLDYVHVLWHGHFDRVIVLVYFILEQDIRVSLWPLDRQLFLSTSPDCLGFYGRKSISELVLAAYLGCLNDTCLKRTYTSLYSVYILEKNEYLLGKKQVAKLGHWQILLEIFWVFDPPDLKRILNAIERTSVPQQTRSR